MSQKTAHAAWGHAALAIVILAGVLAHIGLAVLRSRCLLEHDGSISLLVAAGKAPKIEELYASKAPVITLSAAEIQSWLRPTGDTSLEDVFSSLAEHDIHPPLYFSIAHLLQRWGVSEQALLRLIGTAALLMAVVVADRLVWPHASPAVRCMAAWWLLASPIALEVGTELRQYSLVILGIVLSQAAIIQHWNGQQRRGSIILLLAAAPVILLWSQFGTMVWISAAVVLVAIPCLARRSGACRQAVFAVILALILLAPLVIWRLARGPLPQSFPPLSGSEFRALGLERSLHNIGSAVASVPWRWQWVYPWLALVALTGLTVLALRSLRGPARGIWLAALAWMGAWYALLAGGRIPPHAAHAEHLQPILLCMPMVLALATCAVRSAARRRVLVAVFALSALSHGLGVWQMFERRAEQTVMRELRAVDKLLLTAPKRGYLLPVVAAVRPDTTVQIGSPRALMEALSGPGGTDERLLLVHVAAAGNDEGLEELIAQLDRLYAKGEVVWDEPVRRMYAFRRPRNPAGGD